MKFKKKLLKILTTTFLTTTLLVGCSSGNSTTSTEEMKDNEINSNSEKVVVWYWDKTFNGKAMEIAQEIYKKDNPNFELELVDMAKTDLEQKLNTSLISGINEGLPDIILVNDPNAQKYVNSYPGTFADLSESIDYSQFSQYKVDAVTIDNKKYGVPFDVGVSGMFYRRDYLEQAGYKEEDLQNITWDEYIEIGKKVKEATGKYMCTINPNDESLYAIMLQSAGSWFITEDNKGNFVDNDVMKATIETYKKIADSGIAKPVTSWSEFVGSFNAGDTASVVSGVWQISTIKDGQDQAGKWGVAPTPRLNIESSKNASNEGGSCWFVLDNSPRKDSAIDFLSKTIGGSTEFYERFLTECGGVGSYIPAFTSEAYTHQDEFFDGQQVYSLFSQWSTEVPGVSLGMYTAEAKDALKNEIPNILNGANIEESLKKVQTLYEQQVQ